MVAVQILPTAVVIVVDELLLFQLSMRNSALMEDRGIMHYLFLNQEPGNQKGLDLSFAMAFQYAYDQRLEWRRMNMDLSKTDVMILGFARTKGDLLLTVLVVNNPKMLTMMTMPDFLQKYEYFNNGRVEEQVNDLPFFHFQLPFD